MARVASFTTTGQQLKPTGSLAEMMQRRKALAEQMARNTEPQLITHPLQGVANLTRTLFTGLAERNARREETEGRELLAQTIAGINPETGPTQAQIGTLTGLDNELGMSFVRDAIQARRDAAAAAKADAQRMQERGWSVEDREDAQRAAADAAQKSQEFQGGQTKASQTFQTSEREAGQDFTTARDEAAFAKEQQMAADKARLDLATYEAKKKVDAAQPMGTDAVSSMRKEYTARPEFKRYDAMLSGVKQMVAGADRADGPGDMALTYGFIKALDDISAVRGEEVRTAGELGGLYEEAKGWMQKLEGGGMLPNEVRQKFLDAANSMLSTEADTMDQVNAYYMQLAQRGGADPTSVVYPVVRLPRWKAKSVADDVGTYGGGQ